MLWTVWTMLNISPQHRWLGCSVFVWHDKDIISCCLVKPHLTILWWSWYMSKAYVVRIWVCENIQNVWLWWWLLSHFHEGFCPPERASEMSRMGAPLLLQSKKKKNNKPRLILSHLWNVFMLCFLTALKWMRNTCYYSSLSSAVGTVNLEDGWNSCLVALSS